jgi:hypothetical protein
MAEILAVRAPRTVAPDAAQIGGTTVSVETASVGPIDRQPRGDYLSLGLRITNVSQKPIHHRSWSRPGVAVILRDQNGNFYNRLTAPDDRETAIDPGRTIVETLVFEAPPPFATLDLYLPVPGSDERLRFRIPFSVVRHTHTPAQPASADGAVAKQAPTAPAPDDPETDPKVASAVISDYLRGVQDIEGRAMEMKVDDAKRYRRVKQVALLKSLCEKHGLMADQVLRSLGQ